MKRYTGGPMPNLPDPFVLFAYFVLFLWAAVMVMLILRSMGVGGS